MVLSSQHGLVRSRPSYDRFRRATEAAGIEPYATLFEKCICSSVYRLFRILLDPPYVRTSHMVSVQDSGRTSEISRWILGHLLR
jgi:hypothetical protein